MDFTFDQLKEYLDKCFDEQNARIDDKLSLLEMRLTSSFTTEIGELRQEMHDGFASVANTIAHLNDYHDKRHANHDKRITRLESHFSG